MKGCLNKSVTKKFTVFYKGQCTCEKRGTLHINFPENFEHLIFVKDCTNISSNARCKLNYVERSNISLKYFRVFSCITPIVKL